MKIIAIIMTIVSLIIIGFCLLVLFACDPTPIQSVIFTLLTVTNVFNFASGVRLLRDWV